MHLLWYIHEKDKRKYITTLNTLLSIDRGYKYIILHSFYMIYHNEYVFMQMWNDTAVMWKFSME